MFHTRTGFCVFVPLTILGSKILNATNLVQGVFFGAVFLVASLDAIALLIFTANIRGFFANGFVDNFTSYTASETKVVGDLLASFVKVAKIARIVYLAASQLVYWMFASRILINHEGLASLAEFAELPARIFEASHDIEAFSVATQIIAGGFFAVLDKRVKPKSDN